MGVDQSFNSCGIAVIDRDGKLVHSQVIGSDKRQSVYQRSWSILKEIEKIIVERGVRHVAIEGLAMAMSGNATRSLAILQGVIVTNLNYNPPSGHPLDPVRIVAPTSLKKFATGSGKAGKADVIAALPIEIRLTWSLHHRQSLDDLADAYFLATHLRQSVTHPDKKLVWIRPRFRMRIRPKSIQ